MIAVATTERLELREFSPGEAEALFQLNADPEVVRYTGDVPFRDVAEVLELIRSYDNYARDGFGRWSVYRLDTGEYLGWCGLNRRATTGEVDIGFRFRRGAWGRGYATEAAREALRLGFERFGLSAVVARAMRDNVASHRVIAKLGMDEVSRFELDGAEWVQYQLSADEYRSSTAQRSG
jgi:RimJ/RimL family protein N-acetyltransferase